MFIATNVYGWTQLARLAGRDYDRPRAMEAARAAGLTGWEDAYRAPAERKPDQGQSGKRRQRLFLSLGAP